MTRPLYVIASEIRADYRAQGKPMYYAAKPYVDALAELNTVYDFYGMDSADDIVRYLLSNLQTWRGETARRVKAELREALKGI